MRLITTTIIKTLGILCLLFCFIAGAEGQGLPSSKGINQVSDQQLLQFYQQAQKAGLSDDDISGMLMQRGMSATDIGSFKKRLQLLQGNGAKSQPSKGDSAAFTRDTVWVKETPKPKREINIYGFDFFNTPNTSFAPNVQMATPKNYVLGPGDELVITVTGLNENTITGKVSPEGNLKLPYAGLVSVAGITIDQATQRIRSKLQTAYPALASGKTQLFITLGSIKTIHVSIVGEALHQGTYTVSSAAGFFNVLYLSGGPSSNGSLRKIELIRNNNVVETVDFYSFLQKGIFDKNIRLEDQDIIRFPVYQKRVILDGEVKRPAIYELLEKETLTDLLQYAGGLSDKAFGEKAKIVEVGRQERRVRDVAAADFSYFIPRNADSIYFDKISSLYENRIVLQGAVKHPGIYELTNGLTLKQLIGQADGYLETAFLNRGYIKRRKPAGEREMISFNPMQIREGQQADIQLVKEDSVYIFDKDEVTDLPTISIGGAVRFPGSFTYRQGMRLEDLVAMAGGFTITAANHKVEVSRMDKNTADTMANQLIHLHTLNVDSSLQNEDTRFQLQPLDYVFIPQLLNYRVLGNVKIRGEVLFPGDYSLEKRNESVQNLVERAGGISPFASFKDLQVYRNGLRVGTDIFNSPQKQTFLLLPEDSIYVPRNETFVQVNGAVFNQQIVSYSSSKFLYYISAAGGVTDRGKLGKAYVQYSNGINKKIRHFLFFRNYPKVLPGSKIFVPEKSLFSSSLFSTGAIAAYTSIFTALVALISVIKK